MNNCTDLIKKLESLTPHVAALYRKTSIKNTCVVDIKDKELEHELKKISPDATFMTSGAVAFKDNKISTDIPINLFQDMLKKKDVKYGQKFHFRGELKPPDICKIEELHIYSNSLPTVHVRMSCDIEKSNIPTINEVYRSDAISKIAEFIKKTNDISRKNYIISRKFKTNNDKTI